jgi:NADH:ubiquinone oxidoreductase subunit 5 (subunit L)/multisubunit Na+/H+ antiporter MnhA subunit
VLAILCIVWGFVEPWLGGFMHVEGELSLLGAFFNLETPIFFAILVPVGLIIYLTYYKNSGIMQKVRSSSNPLTTVLKHGYFFDHLYEGVTAKTVMGASEKILKHGYFFDDLYVRVITNGFMKISKGLDYIETRVFTEVPQSVARAILKLADATHKYLDVLAEELLSVIAHRTVTSAAKAKKMPSSSMQHYIAAALLGFILILILIILTMGV